VFREQAQKAAAPSRGDCMPEKMKSGFMRGKPDDVSMSEEHEGTARTPFAACVPARRQVVGMLAIVPTAWPRKAAMSCAANPTFTPEPIDRGKCSGRTQIIGPLQRS
jgi:hypothetical protein